MIDRKRICGVLVAVVAVACFAACSGAEPGAPSSGNDSEASKTNEPASRDDNGSDRGDQSGIASFQDKVITSCWVTLDWCDTPWISPHPQATCHSTGCDCAYAKQVCKSLVEQNCGAVISYGNDCR